MIYASFLVSRDLCPSIFSKLLHKQQSFYIMPHAILYVKYVLYESYMRNY